MIPWNGDARVLEWEIGLPSADDLTPLSQSLIPPELAAAFSISPEPVQTRLDVHRASHETVSFLRRLNSPSTDDDDPVALHAEEPPRKIHRSDAPPAAVEEADCSPLRLENPNDDHPSARALKRPRLVWTPQLHKRFVDVVAHLGINNAVPKTIMQLMNVEGLTRENVASHLQKYRLYLKKMTEGPSSSDHPIASTPVPPQSLHQPMPMPYAMRTMIPMPVFASPHHGPMGMVSLSSHQGGGAYHGFESSRLTY